MYFWLTPMIDFQPWNQIQFWDGRFGVQRLKIASDLFHRTETVRLGSDIGVSRWDDARLCFSSLECSIVLQLWYIPKPNLLEVVGRKAQHVHALAKAFETRQGFEVTPAVLPRLLVVAMMLMVLCSVVVGILARPPHDLFVGGLASLLLLLLPRLGGLALVFSLVIHSNELFLGGRPFGSGFQSLHEFTDAFLSGTLLLVDIAFERNDSQASDHTFPQKTLLVRSSVGFRLFLYPLCVVVD